MAQSSKPQHAYPANHRPGHQPRRALTRLLCVLLALQPMLAQAAPALAQSTTLEAPEGKVSLLAKTDTDYTQKKRREADLLWWNERDRGQVKETVRPVEIEAGGGLRIHAGRGVVIEYHKTGDLRASLEQLAEAPGLKWIASLQADPRVDWRGVEAAFREWDYAQSGLTEAGAALVALATAAATWGVSAKLSAALTKALPSAMQGAAMSTALTAGTRTLFMQAGVALVNNKGDIGATLKQLASTDTLRALATAMVTAGLTAHLEQAAGLGGELTRTAHYMQRGLLRATVRAGVGTAIQGGSLDENFIRALQLQAVSTLGELGAREIGQAFREQKIDRFTQLLAHAALGCATGSVAGDCGAGALGGVVGELAAQALLDNKTAVKVGEELAEAVQSGQLSAARAEALAWGWQARGVDLSVLAAGLSVALAGGDVDVGAGAAENAVRHNALCFGVCVGVGGALAVMGALWTAYDVSKTYREEGGEAALRQLARDGAIVVVTSGTGAVAYKVGGAVFESGAKAWRAVRERGIWKRFVEKNVTVEEVNVTKRPSSFRKQTVQDAWDKATPGSKLGTKACPTCGKDVKVAPGQGRRD